jgi:hypothetical protein
MSLFFRIMERLTGRPVEKQKMSVLCDSEADADEIEALARMTLRAIQTEIQFAPPGKKLNIITTADLPDKRENKLINGGSMIITTNDLEWGAQKKPLTTQGAADRASEPAPKKPNRIITTADLDNNRRPKGKNDDEHNS